MYRIVPILLIPIVNVNLVAHFDGGALCDVNHFQLPDEVDVADAGPSRVSLVDSADFTDQYLWRILQLGLAQQRDFAQGDHRWTASQRQHD